MHPRELRDNVEALAQTLVTTPGGAMVPLAQVAYIRIHQGPPAIKSENAWPNAWVYVDLRGIDVGTWADLRQAVDHGAVQRIRPKMMTVAAILLSLVPILWATGSGADIMRRIAAPMVGGVIFVTSDERAIKIRTGDEAPIAAEVEGRLRRVLDGMKGEQR